MTDNSGLPAGHQRETVRASPAFGVRRTARSQSSAVASRSLSLAVCEVRHLTPAVRLNQGRVLLASSQHAPGKLRHAPYDALRIVSSGGAPYVFTRRVKPVSIDSSRALAFGLAEVELSLVITFVWGKVAQSIETTYAA